MEAKKYLVTLPVVGYVTLEVVAGSKKLAIKEALEATESEFTPVAIFTVKSFDDASFCDCPDEAVVDEIQ